VPIGGHLAASGHPLVGQPSGFSGQTVPQAPCAGCSELAPSAGGLPWGKPRRSAGSSSPSPPLPGYAGPALPDGRGRGPVGRTSIPGASPGNTGPTGGPLAWRQVHLPRPPRYWRGPAACAKQPGAESGGNGTASAPIRPRDGGHSPGGSGFPRHRGPPHAVGLPGSIPGGAASCGWAHSAPFGRRRSGSRAGSCCPHPEDRLTRGAVVGGVPEVQIPWVSAVVDRDAESVGGWSNRAPEDAPRWVAVDPTRVWKPRPRPGPYPYRS
jgi:hypothetical protein